MSEFVSKIFDSLSKDYKSLLIQTAIIFPVVYSCIFICVDISNSYELFDRI